jgi:hypothetical protein
MKSKFKIGDLVYAKGNSGWGREPMKITALSLDYDTKECYGATCYHRVFKMGWFAFPYLVRYTRKRARALVEFALKEKEMNKLKKKLFI